MIYCAEKDKKEFKDTNLELLALEGELSNLDTQLALARFLKYNLGFTVELVSGIKLAAYQEAILKGMFGRNYVLNVMGRGTGKTLRYNEHSYLISKDKGLITVKDLVPDVEFKDEEYWRDIPETLLWNGKNYAKTTKVLVQKGKNCLRIKTRLGYELEGSTNHLVKCADYSSGKCEIVWKRYHELTTKDYVCISRDEVEWNTTEDKKDADEAYFIGVLVGDGCYCKTRSGFSIISADKEIRDFVKSYPFIRECRKKGECYEIFYSKEYGDGLLEKYDIKRSLSYDKKIPQKILSSKSLLKHFLSGLFDADGCSEKRPVISFCSVSEILAKQVHNSLLTFGIISSLAVRKTKSTFGRAYHIQINGENALKFYNRIGFRLARKQKGIKNIEGIKSNTNIDIIPGIKRSTLKIKSGNNLCAEHSREWRSSIRKRSQKNIGYESLGKYINFFRKIGIETQKYEHLERIQSDNFFFDRIKTIDESQGDCIDFNVPHGECYWSNGFISHNSFLASIYCFLKCLFEPNTKIILAGPTFRTARNIFTELEKIVKNKDAQLLAQAFSAEAPAHRPDLFSWEFTNGSSIRAIPLNGEKIRGFRANVLIIDEFLLISEDMVRNVLMPFLVAPHDIKERLKIKEIEDDLIAAGKMEVKERTVFANTAQMICLSSASFTFEYLYTTYKTWMNYIYDEEVRDSSYFISQLSYEAIPPEMVESTVIEEASNGGLQSPSFLREYCARFTDGSEGYFSAQKMKNCTIADGDEPTLRLMAKPEKKYIISIDPNFGGGAASDYFAMAVIEVGEDRKMGALVHNYAQAGGDLKNHINYFYYLYKYFKPVFVIADNADGNFLQSCNESEKFVSNGIQLNFMDEWDATIVNDPLKYKEMLAKAKRDYNPTIHRICVKHLFTSDTIRQINEHLQGCIDFKKIWFGSKIRPNTSACETAMSLRISLKEINLDLMTDLIDTQDDLIDQVKKQCSLVEVKSSSQGNQTFDLPQHLKRSKSATRARKDNYTALLLGAWGLKCYNDIIDYEPENVIHTFEPIFIP